MDQIQGRRICGGERLGETTRGERREDIKRMGIHWFQGWGEILFEEEQRMEQPHIEIIRENKIIEITNTNNESIIHKKKSDHSHEKECCNRMRNKEKANTL